MPNRTEEVASKAMGAVKVAKATIEGLSGVFKQLAKEHGEVAALLMRVKMSSDAEVRRSLFPTIRQDLLLHEKGELREVYPVFAQHPELQRMATDHQQEAGQLERLLTDLSAIRYDDQGWEPMFGRLVDLVLRHTREEENDYFPTATRVLGEEQAERMKDRYNAVRREMMQQPPSA